MNITYTETRNIPADKLLAIYEAVGWSNYTRRPEDIPAALAASSWACAAWQGDTLVGLVRVLSDGQFVAWVQDVLVHPQYQRRGIGRELMTRCLRRYARVDKVVLLTDDEPRQQAFYASLGLKRMEEVSGRLRCYVGEGGVNSTETGRENE